MNQRLFKLMFELIRYEMGMEEALNEDDIVFVANNLEPLYMLSKSHDMAHILAGALFKTGIIGCNNNSEISKRFNKQYMLSIFRCEQTSYELNRISEILEAEKIPFMPLKGAVVRELYPQLWMRTSCDIDILVKEEDLSRTVKALKEGLEYSYREDRKYHDISLFSPSGVHLELHFSIKENMESIDRLLSAVWENSTLVDGKKYWHQLTNEYLIFYHIAHMAYHFINGGCGIRAFLDLYLMHRRMQYDHDKLYAFCSACNLQKFYDNITELTNVWFEGKLHEKLTLQAELYILRGGVYGNLETKVAARQGKSGGKFRYALSRVFLPVKELKISYPCLEKHVWLTPFCQIHRWFKILFNIKHFKHSMAQLKSNGAISKEQTNKMKQFLYDMGL